jgi:hypothetical protein
MATYVTTQCHLENHQEITFSVADASGLSCDWLIRYFETEVSRGVHFRHGETIQIGWVIVRLEQATDNLLEILEPSFDSMPIKWIKGLNNTLRHLILQQEICKEMEFDSEFPSILQAGIISPGYMKTSQDFVMSRDHTSGADSGWVFHEPDYAGTSGEYKSLYEIALSNMEIVPFLALPSSTSVSKHQKVIKLRHQERQVSSATNEFLQKIAVARM